jgi:hypothetical protein
MAASSSLTLKASRPRGLARDLSGGPGADADACHHAAQRRGAAGRFDRGVALRLGALDELSTGLCLDSTHAPRLGPCSRDSRLSPGLCSPKQITEPNNLQLARIMQRWRSSSGRLEGSSTPGCSGMARRGHGAAVVGRGSSARGWGFTGEGDDGAARPAAQITRRGMRASTSANIV